MAEVVDHVFYIFAVNSLFFLGVREHVGQVFDEMAEGPSDATGAEDKCALSVLPLSGCGIWVLERE